MDEELMETLQLIIARYDGREQGSVFIPMKDFSWHHEKIDNSEDCKKKG